MPKILFYGKVSNYKQYIKYNEYIVNLYKNKDLITKIQHKKIIYNIKYAEEASKHPSFFFNDGDKVYGIPICSKLAEFKGIYTLLDIKANINDDGTNKVKLYNYNIDLQNLKIVGVKNILGLNIKAKFLESLEDNEDAIKGRFENNENFEIFKKFMENIDENSLTEENMSYLLEIEDYLEDIFNFNVENNLINKNLEIIKIKKNIDLFKINKVEE